MNKYLEITKIYLKAQLIWKADVIFNMIFTVTKIIFAYLLWSVIFTGKDVISGFTFHGMLSYYIISSFLSQLDMSGDISWEISTRIRNGTFSKYMVVPVNTQAYFIAMETGAVLFNIIFDFLAAIVWIFIFRIQFFITASPFLLFSALAVIILGLFFMVQLNYFLGILTLKFQEISTFLMIKDNFVALITGTMIPLVFLPDTVLQFMKIFPFYYITYLPSMLLIGKGEEEALKGIVIMIVWCSAFQLINRAVYEKYRIKFDGVGI